MRTITIDSIAREIRFYGEDAVAFLSSDNPCEISFDPGEANIIINEVVVRCAFHQPAKEINVSGKIYRCVVCLWGILFLLFGRSNHIGSLFVLQSSFGSSNQGVVCQR